MELELHHVLIDVSDRQATLGTDADYAASYTEFGARVLVSPDIVGVRHRPVDFARNPIACALGLYGHRSVHVSQTCDTGGRIRSRLFGVILRVILRSFERLIFRALTLRIGRYPVGRG